MQPPSGSPPDQYPPPPPPGTVTAVRVLLIIGGVLGALAAVAVAVGMAVVPPLVAESPEVREGLEQEGIDPGALMGTMLFALVQSLVYGGVALVLAFQAKRRTATVYLATVAFFALAVVYTLGAMVLEGQTYVLALLFNVAALVLLFLPATREHYGVGT
ncbi:hypothetical protein O4J56_21335 [Nocardiopsis sp. RSe5-2]|uniref:DUF4345 domain-containing protein n=1 Tax=Nocardiopsis endophytica TaxID=3018445 RepID=A0ABT4U8C7_9ACTN|nr:hypothetical protein [Nocardiopsis endophytica]MDA2813203.1 hypothetical protein [Nocardiopsis endophytica]